jgi:hypothetical protein
MNKTLDAGTDRNILIKRFGLINFFKESRIFLPVMTSSVSFLFLHITLQLLFKKKIPAKGNKVNISTQPVPKGHEMM